VLSKAISRLPNLLMLLLLLLLRALQLTALRRECRQRKFRLWPPLKLPHQ
jgi:hypothetical protein